MTYRDAMKEGTRILQEAGVMDPKLDAWYLLVKATKINRNYYYLHEMDELREEDQKDFELLIKERAKRIPLQYIIGEQEFMGFTFQVNSSVLIPRQDTEILVEEALKVLNPGDRLLDVCTGSGCIAISIAKKKENLQVTACDISKQALIVAKENGKINQATIDWVWSDLFEHIEGCYDVIVSNPPYIPTAVIETLQPEVRDYEPVSALDGTEDGLFFYRRIVEECQDYLKPNGMLLMEIGHDQGEDVSRLLIEAGFSEVIVVKDLAGLDRVVKGRK